MCLPLLVLSSESQSQAATCEFKRDGLQFCGECCLVPHGYVVPLVPYANLLETSPSSGERVLVYDCYTLFTHVFRVCAMFAARPEYLLRRFRRRSSKRWS